VQEYGRGRMNRIKNPNMKLKEKLDENDYKDINNLQKLCLEKDKTALKLELDYKLGRAKEKSENLSSINEFMYYDENKLIGYVGIGQYGGNTLEVNGMVHPEYRRRGIFKRLFSLVKDEWGRRESPKMLLLSDHNSASGLGFIKYTSADYDCSEYEMYLKNNVNQGLPLNNVVLRKATNSDAEEAAKQNSIYFDIEYNDKDISKLEEEEKCGLVTYMAEVDSKIIGKVNLETANAVGVICGLGVRPEYRRNGYGREILVGAIEKLKENGLKDIMLQVAAKNKNALELYRSCGFVETSTMDYHKICKK
jgi:ribosomal protein S18 acetylase RimI-like enzyme